MKKIAFIETPPLEERVQQHNDRLVESSAKRPGQERTYELRDRLLALGGRALCIHLEEDMDKILDRGEVVRPYGRLIKGKNNRCHFNSAAIWLANQDRTELMTGYALSADGIWRQHTWLLIHHEYRKAVIETTVRRSLYYGFRLTREEALQFADENDISIIMEAIAESLAVKARQ